jgi:hypothetical protein
MTFQQIWSQSKGELDLRTLATELAQLHTAMRESATSAEHDAAIGEVAVAEVAATEGNGPTTLEHLKKAGRWALDVATEIGVSVAGAALKTSLGL